MRILIQRSQTTRILRLLQRPTVAYKRLVAWFRRPMVLLIVAVLLLSLAIPLVSNYLVNERYQLNQQTQALLGPADSTLASRFSLVDQDKSFYFNKKGLDAAPPVTKDAANPAVLLKQMQKQVGGGSTKDKSLYSVKLPTDASKGVTYFDNNLSLSFSMTPQFKLGTARNVAGRIVYPGDAGLRAVYTAKSNGLKEDLILTSHPNKTKFNYKLQLPKELQARLTPEGGLGIYSADPGLFGNITYGSPDDEAKVTSARNDGAKNNLVFALPAPVINQTGGKTGQGSAQFQLNDDILTITTGKLNTLKYPISIDPTVVITSSADFATGNNEDSSIDYSTAGQINRGGLTGGSLNTGAWTLNGTAFTTARNAHTSVVYNGYLYVIGGLTAGPIYNNDVQYAPINANGTIGTWQYTFNSASSAAFVGGFTNARATHTSVAYNGYLYVIGGGNATIKYNDVQYAPINADGTIGTWNTTTAFTTIRNGHTSVVYNGYLYVIGGNSAVKLNDIQYAPINADGTIGAWQYTFNSASSAAFVGGFSTARFSHTSVVYNGYLYVIGGDDGASLHNDVQYAPINANGTVGTWTTTTAFTNPRYGHTSVVANGYLYVIGGGSLSPALLNDVQYAPINANGTIGTWTTTTVFTTARNGHTSVVANGYLYVIGGSSTGSVNNNDVQYIKINPPGVTAAYVAQVNKPATARAFASGVAYNGYLYLVGGCTVLSGDTCTTASTVVSFAQIGTNGTLGVWADTTNALPAARGMGSAVAYEGFLYYVAGRPTSTTVSPTVYYAPVSTTTGNTTAVWTAIASPTGLTARYGQAAALYNGNLYVIGGCTTASGTCATVLNDTEQAVLNPAGGIATNPNCANNFCPLNTFLTARWGHAAVVAGGKLYISGGTKTASSVACSSVSASITCDDVQYAALNANGTVGVWASTVSSGPGSTNSYAHNFYQSNGYLYITNGKSGTASIVTGGKYAKLTTTGVIATDSGCGTSWCVTTADSGEAASAYAAYNGYLYVIGGQPTGTTVTTNVSVAAINNGGQGTSGAWTTTSSFTNSREHFASVVYNGYLYVIGGLTGTSTYLNDVQYAPINADGTFGTWQYTFNSASSAAFVGGFTTARNYNTSVVSNGYLYVIGGTNATTKLNDVQYAPINADGTIGTWQYTFNSASSAAFVGGFTTVRYSQTLVVYNGYLYVMGGFNSVDLNDVQYAPINANGTIGAWQYTFNSASSAAFVGGFTTTREGHTSIASNGYLYVIGGINNGITLNDVQYAPINANGTIGTWTTTTAFTTARFNHTSIASNGYLYVIGGGNQTDVQYAPINANGTIGTWTTTTPAFSTARANHTSVVYNGYLYAIGGRNSTISFASSQSAPLNVISRVNHYSRLVDLGTTTNISNISFTGSLPGGSQSIGYRLAGTNGLFGTTALASVLTGACTAGGTTRYVSLYITLDDSVSGTFPDGNTASLQDLTINYYGTVGVFPAQRLFGGKTLQQVQRQSPLDTTKTYPGPSVCT